MGILLRKVSPLVGKKNLQYDRRFPIYGKTIQRTHSVVSLKRNKDNDLYKFTVIMEAIVDTSYYMPEPKQPDLITLHKYD